MTWVERLHPRDEYGRFRLGGVGGVFDRLAAQADAHQSARLIDEYEANWRRQFDYFQPLQAAGKLTPELDRQWDADVARRAELERLIPPAHGKHMEPHVNGFWYYRQDYAPGQVHIPHDRNGLRLPRAAVMGWTRVGDHPNRRETDGVGRVLMHDVTPEMSPLSGGVWHAPGDYNPGRVPRLVNDYGHPMTQLDPELARSRRYRDRLGRAARLETHLERNFIRDSSGDTAQVERRRRGKIVQQRESTDYAVARLLDPRQPLSRVHSARSRQKRKRSNWIRVASDHIGNQRGVEQ